jgi:hydrogenase 3 maturation protease
MRGLSGENCSFHRAGIERILQKWLSHAKKVVLAGIGNPLRKDDFIGVKIVKDLENKVSQNVFLIECETVPESFIAPIVEFKPTHVLLIDASLLNLESGSVKFVEADKVASQIPVSTHALPLQLFCECLVEMTHAKIALLAIQPKDTDFGEGLTPEIKKTAEYLTNLLLKILP